MLKCTIASSVSDYICYYSVVLVHGIHGNGKNDWFSTNNPERIWLTRHIFDQLPLEYCWVRYLRYGYSDQVSSPHAISKPGQIEHHAEQFLKAILKLSPADPETLSRPLVIVSNDIGGLIVKQVGCSKL